MRRRPQRPLAVEQLEKRQFLTAAPVRFAALPVSASEVGLSWEFADADNVGVVIERRAGSATEFATVAVLGAGETIYTDAGCWSGTTYTYRAKARGAAGDSGYTDEWTVTSLQVGAGAYTAPTSLTIAPLSPTTAQVSFIDANAGQASHLLERSADGVSWMVVASLGTATTWQDTGLEPGSSYWYRGRDVGWAKPTSDYSTAVQVVMPMRPAAVPPEPSAVSAVSVSATAVQLSWKAADLLPTQYAIDRSVGYDPWHAIAWSRIATTAVNATSFTDIGLAPETPYVYRVRAVRNGLESDPGRPASDVMHVLFGSAVGVVTASVGSGTPRVYDIGPGRPLARLADLDWNRLGPGDVVNVHWKPGGYHELLQISCRGTAAAWITINGVPDPVTNALPVIDATDAVLDPQFRNHYAPLHGSGAVVVGARPGFAQGYKPGFIEIKNLDIRNCHAAQRFTDADGSTKPYGLVGAGIYLERCDHVRIANCAIHDNGDGIFGAGQSGFDRVMTDITIDSNRIWGNGNVGRDREHNTYLEAIDVVYQFNRYGPLRPGALGAGLKDRSVGTVIRSNWIEGGAHQLQLPEAQNQADLAIALPRYHRTLVSGNTLVAPPGDGASLIWFGGDQGLTPWYRKGVLSLVHNTLVARSDQAQVWKINAVEAASAGEAIDARNNIFAALPATSGGTRPDFGLVGRDNRVAFGRTWVTPGWVPTTTGDYGFSGLITGMTNFIGSSVNDPGFVDVATGDYRLAIGSACIDAAGALPESLAAWPVTNQFQPPVGGIIRPVNGQAADLGSFELDAGGGTQPTTPVNPPPVTPPATQPAPPAPPSQPSPPTASPPSRPPVSPARLRAAAVAATRVRLTWTDRSRDETGFVVERWQRGGSWTRLAITAANARSFLDTTAVRGTSYAYRIRAIGGPAMTPVLSAATAIVWVRTPLRGR